MAGINETNRLVNTVTFKVDQNSLKQAKKAIQSLQKFSKQQADFTQGFSKYTSAAKKAEQQIAQIQAQRINKQAQGINTVAAAQRQADRQAQAAAKRIETAELRRRNTLLTLTGIMGRTADQENEVAREAIRITRAFETGAISAQRMNQEIREQLTLTRRLARSQATANRGSRRAGAGSAGAGGGGAAGALGLGALAGPVGVAAAAAGVIAHEVISKVSDTVTDTTERNQQVITGGKAVHVNPNALLTLAAYARQHGVMDSNPERVQDNLN